MQRRIRANKLRENDYGTMYPAPTSRIIDISAVNGGLNLWDLPYKMAKNQSPDLVNMYWKDGCLCSRQGQSYIYENRDSDGYGNCWACYSQFWKNRIIAHKGSKLFVIDPNWEYDPTQQVQTPMHTEIYSGLSEKSGTFFIFQDSLYYMNGADYVKIYESEETILGETVRVIRAKSVLDDAYIPTTVINRHPNGTGGSLLEDENRISRAKIVEFTTDGTSTDYTLPSGYAGLDSDRGLIIELTSPSAVTYHEVQTVAALPTTKIIDVYFNVSGAWYVWDDTEDDYVVTTEPSNKFTVNRSTAVITFSTAPSAALTESPSNLKVKLFKSNPDAMNAILSCRCATVFGGDTDLAVVFGGPTAQPNAYFWSGVGDSIDASYFPMSYYNFAGSNTNEAITGFGKQQSMLVIFQEESIGKSYFTSVTTTSEVSYLQLSYTPINDSIGCDIPGSIRLIQNNIIFANKSGGVYALLDSSAYGENTVKRLSRNINGDGNTKGLLHDLRTSQFVSSYDDSQRYWIVAKNHVYLWDYTLSGIASKEEKLSWFYFDNVPAIAWVKDLDTKYYFKRDGSVVKFVDTYSDFSDAIVKRYTFATFDFGTYEVLKNVNKLLISTRSDTDSLMSIRYKTDYEDRYDRTTTYDYTWRTAPVSLDVDDLEVPKYARVYTRTPKCFNIRHFTLILENRTLDSDLSILGAQIMYNYSRQDR